MTHHESVEMDSDERDEFLATGGTGVMSFSTESDAPPHSIPVSYGSDATETSFYFRLAVDTDSAKGDPAERAVSVVIYGRTDDTWRSVVASGRLEETTEPDRDRDARRVRTRACSARRHLRPAAKGRPVPVLSPGSRRDHRPQGVADGAVGRSFPPLGASSRSPQKVDSDGFEHGEDGPGCSLRCASGLDFRFELPLHPFL